MSDTTPERDTTPPADPPPTAESGTSRSKVSRTLDGSERSLDRRWWWQAFVFTAVGIAIIGFQWQVITTGQAIVATWIMVVIGAGLVVVGAVTAWRDRPRGTSDV